MRSQGGKCTLFSCCCCDRRIIHLPLLLLTSPQACLEARAAELRAAGHPKRALCLEVGFLALLSWLKLTSLVSSDTCGQGARRCHREAGSGRNDPGFPHKRHHQGHFLPAGERTQGDGHPAPAVRGGPLAEHPAAPGRREEAVSGVACKPTTNEEKCSLTTVSTFTHTLAQ